MISYSTFFVQLKFPYRHDRPLSCFLAGQLSESLTAKYLFFYSFVQMLCETDIDCNLCLGVTDLVKLYNPGHVLTQQLHVSYHWHPSTGKWSAPKCRGDRRSHQACWYCDGNGKKKVWKSKNIQLFTFDTVPTGRAHTLITRSHGGSGMYMRWQIAHRGELSWRALLQHTMKYWVYLCFLEQLLSLLPLKAE